MDAYRDFQYIERMFCRTHEEEECCEAILKIILKSEQCNIILSQNKILMNIGPA